MSIITLDQRERFNELYNDDDNGGPWTLKGRNYVRDHIWRPLESYRAWPRVGPGELCGRCRDRVDTWFDDPLDVPPHVPTEYCPGLAAIPIISTGVNVPRRSGKTLNALSYAFPSLFLEQNEKIAFIASAEDQSEELIKRKLGSKIEKHPKLVALSVVTAMKITVPSNNSMLEVLPASHASVTGRGYTKIFVDEARDLDARVLTALIPSLASEHGAKCPHGCGSWRAVDDVVPFTHCPTLRKQQDGTFATCGARLRRWHARILISSASGITEDNASKDWFNEWVDLRLKKPDPSTHVWRTDKRVNPSVSTEITNAIRGGFADVPGLKDYLGVELDNQPARKGEKFITEAELKNIIDPRLPELTKSAALAVGFIDTSRTGDKTSLVIVIDESETRIYCQSCWLGINPKDTRRFTPSDEQRTCRYCGAETERWLEYEEIPLTRLRVAHIKVWDPTDLATCPTGSINETDVEEHLDEIVPNFPELLSLEVDTRIMPWAKTLVSVCQRKPWGTGRVEPFEGNSLENSAMYLELLQRVAGSQGKEKILRSFPHPELERELLALRKRDLPGGGIVVYDAGAGKDGRNRKVGGIHRDIAMSLAGCCLKAAKLRIDMPERLDAVAELQAELERSMPRSPVGDLLRGKF